MGCCGDREKGLDVTEQQKWDYITLSDFKSTSCLTPFSYVWLWILVLISAAVYAADAFTAVNLLAFNKWSSQVKPKVDFDITKWIFAGCIIASYVFLIYRWIRAIRVMRSGSVAECYLEPLAAIFQSMNLTSEGQGWRRFLVFAELTKSRKGADYVALFAYFQFKSALIIIAAQGPRIAINALTLWAVMQAQIIPEGEHAAPQGKSPVAQFFSNIETMVNTGNKQETIVYFTMLFSLVIWVIAFLSLLVSVLFYIFFLWHYIPKADGSLTQYCRRKIETRLERIVNKKMKKALEKQNMRRKKEEREGLKHGGGEARMPTLPKLGGIEDDTSSIYSGITRSDTTKTSSTFAPPSYSSNTMSRTATMSTTRSGGMNPTLPSLGKRPLAARTDTEGSTTSFGSNAPLLSQAEDMGIASPMPPLPPLDPSADYFPKAPGPRSGPSSMVGRPYGSMPQNRIPPYPPRAMPPPVDTGFGGRDSPAPRMMSPQGSASYSNRRPGAPSLGEPTFSPYNHRGPSFGPSYEMSPVDANATDNDISNRGPNDLPRPQFPEALRPGSPAQRQQVGPARVGTAPPSKPRVGLPVTLHSAIQRREASQPLMNRGTPMQQQQRSATAPPMEPTPRDTPAPGAPGYQAY